MQFLLDTNICIHFFKGEYNLIDKLQTIGLSNCAISEITLAEMVFGAENSASPKKNHELIVKLVANISILPIYDSIYIYGKEKARLRKKGKMISDFDLLIGCTAVEKDLIMVTENTREFKRISKIKLENWIDRTV